MTWGVSDRVLYKPDRNTVQKSEMLAGVGVANFQTSHYDSVPKHSGPPLPTNELRANKRSQWICEMVWMLPLGVLACIFAGMMIGSWMTWITPALFVIGGLLLVNGFVNLFSLYTHREEQIYPDQPETNKTNPP